MTTPTPLGPLDEGAAESFVALIRGVNVGRAKRVAMADLRALLHDLDYTDVRTLLNSGNAVFSAPSAAETEAGIADRIRVALADRLGVAAPVIVLAGSELAEAIAGNPFAETAGDPSRLLVAFFADPADAVKLSEVARRDWSPEAVAVGRRVAYLWCPGGVTESRVSRAVEGALPGAVTARNWTTVLKLREMVGGGPG